MIGQLLRSQYAFSAVILVALLMASLAVLAMSRRSGQVTRELDRRFREDR